MKNYIIEDLQHKFNKNVFQRGEDNPYQQPLFEIFYFRKITMGDINLINSILKKYRLVFNSFEYYEDESSGVFILKQL